MKKETEFYTREGLELYVVFNHDNIDEAKKLGFKKIEENIFDFIYKACPKLTWLFQGLTDSNFSFCLVDAGMTKIPFKAKVLSLVSEDNMDDGFDDFEFFNGDLGMFNDLSIAQILAKSDANVATTVSMYIATDDEQDFNAGTTTFTYKDNSKLLINSSGLFAI